MTFQEGQMSRLNVRMLLVVLFLVPMLTCATVLAAAELGSLTICRGVAGPELYPVDPANEFAPDTAAIHAVALIRNGTPSTKVTGTWISVDAISTPNYEINSGDLVLGKQGTVNAHFELSKPTKGWPVGNYRVNIFIDGNKAGSASFSVK
jgi:hypothetical protein